MAVDTPSLGEPPRLLPEEDAALGIVADKRREDFTAGRGCARRALMILGMPEVPLLVGRDRAPEWPLGVVGSITHCDRYAAAVVASTDGYRAIGIDAEPALPLPDGVLQQIALKDECSWIADQPEPWWDRMLFSAKESVYKAWCALAGMWLGFEDARVDFDLVASRFHAELQPTQPPGGWSSFDGRFRVVSGFLLTAVIVPAS